MKKLNEWKDKFNKGYLLAIICILLILSGSLGTVMYFRQKKYIQVSENSNNMAFFELVNYVQNIENYLAKSFISSTPEHGAETLTYLWREADLAQSYLSRLPIESQELQNTEKFLNQVSDYSYSLSRKNIYNESLTQEDFDNLKELHKYSIELQNTLNQLSDDLNTGRIKWKELEKKGAVAFAQQVDNLSKESFINVENNFHEYTGLIYDGAYSEHMISTNKDGIAGEEISENDAKEIAQKFVGKENIEEIGCFGFSENADIPSFDFSIKTKSEENVNISISQRGGHVIYMNSDQIVNSEILNMEEAGVKAKEYLEQKGFRDMKETYYLKKSGIVTINYAATQNDIIMYPDLIKVKVALDNGKILGIETTGYLINHIDRQLAEIKIMKEEAKKTLNPELEILSEGLAIIPTEFKTEILCYEFKGKIENREFLVYINVENGREEDILVITDTPNGILVL